MVGNFSATFFRFLNYILLIIPLILIGVQVYTLLELKKIKKTIAKVEKEQSR